MSYCFIDKTVSKFCVSLFPFRSEANLKNFTFPETEEEFFPANGIGKFLLDRKELVTQLTDEFMGNNFSSYYFRAPAGSGKSVRIEMPYYLNANCFAIINLIDCFAGTNPYSALSIKSRLEMCVKIKE